jgi:hypothetical protein
VSTETELRKDNPQSVMSMTIIPPTLSFGKERIKFQVSSKYTT